MDQAPGSIPRPSKSPAESATLSSSGLATPPIAKVVIAFCALIFAFAVGLTYNGWNVAEAARIGGAVSAIALLGIGGVVRYSHRTRPTSDGRRLSMAAFTASVVFAVFAVVPAVPLPLLGLALIPFVPHTAFKFSTQRLGLVIAATVALSVLSIAGIFLWWTTRSGVLFVSILPTWLPQDSAAIVVFCILLAVTNSVYEEVLWRHLLFRMSKGFVAPMVSVVLLSILFGMAHLAAIPDGIVGVVLTSAFSVGAFALIRLARGNLLPAIAAHFLADFTVLLLLTRVI